MTCCHVGPRNLTQVGLGNSHRYLLIIEWPTPNHYFSMFQVYANGIRNIDLYYIIRKLAAPVISVLLLSLCVPYVIASGAVPLLGG